MILADTSAWAEFLRGSGHPTDRAIQRLVRSDEIVVTEPVIMELLAGASSDHHAEVIQNMLSRHLVVPVGGVETFEEAASIHRACRSRGDGVRNTIDCLIAAVAIRVDAPVLHKDRDFGVIARHTGLRIEPAA